MDRMINGLVRQLESPGEAEIPVRHDRRIGDEGRRPSMRSPMCVSLRSIAIFAKRAISGRARRTYGREKTARRKGGGHLMAFSGQLATFPALPWRSGGAISARPPKILPWARWWCWMAWWSGAAGPKSAAACTPSPGAGAGRRLASGATLYVTLEPCAHHGRTPPCAEAVVASGMARVVAASPTPTPASPARALHCCGEPASRWRPTCWRICAARPSRPYLARDRRTPDGHAKNRAHGDGQAAAAARPRLAITGPAANPRTHVMRACTTPSWWASAPRSTTIR